MRVVYYLADPNFLGQDIGLGTVSHSWPHPALLPTGHHVQLTEKQPPTSPKDLGVILATLDPCQNQDG